MSDETPGGGIENSIRAAYDRLPEIAAKRKTSRLIKWLLPLAVLAVVTAGLYSLGQVANHNLLERSDEMKTEFQRHANKILPRVEREARAAANRVLPKLQTELARAHEKAGENLQDALNTHTKELGDRLEKRMNDKLAEELDTVARQQTSKLKSDFPDLLECTRTDTPKQCEAKEERLARTIEEIQRAYRDYAIMEMRTTFDGHLTAMDDIRATMEGFAKPIKAADGSTEGVAPDAPAEMLVLFLEIAAETLGGHSDTFEKAEE